MRKHLLQSKEWEKYEEIEKKTVVRVSGKDFDALATINPTKLGTYIYLPYGPALEEKGSKKALNNALGALKTLALEKKADFIRIEPTTRFTALEIANTAKKHGMIAKKSHNLDPEYTWVLDLDASEEDILKGMESRKVRYWRNAEKKSITIRTSKDPKDTKILTDFLSGLGKKDGFIPQTKSHLENQLKAESFATLYIADYTDPETKKTVPIAAALIYDYEDTRYYAHAATDDEHRKFQAGSILLIQMILDAKKEGKKTYDFWGMTKSTDPNHPWYHFTQYKMSFGGHEVAYSGTYDLILNKTKYNLYNLARKANRLVRKIKA